MLYFIPNPGPGSTLYYIFIALLLLIAAGAAGAGLLTVGVLVTAKSIIQTYFREKEARQRAMVQVENVFQDPESGKWYRCVEALSNEYNGPYDTEEEARQTTISQ